MRAIFFPLGDTQDKGRRLKRRCIWREMTLLYILITSCINPKVSLKSVVADWCTISERLEAPKRKRARQMSGFT